MFSVLLFNNTQNGQEHMELFLGARIGFRGKPSGHVRRQNHSTIAIHPEIITESI
jgi:hypothetical protein